MSQEFVMFEIVAGYSIWHGLILKQQKNDKITESLMYILIQFFHSLALSLYILCNQKKNQFLRLNLLLW